MRFGILTFNANTKANLSNVHEHYLHPRYSTLIDVSDAQIWQILLRYPLELMEEFISVDDDFVRIKPALWLQMTAADLVELKEIVLRRIETYYDELA